MAQINAVLLPTKVLKGGGNRVRISIAHNGETRYIVTDIAVASPSEFRNGAVVRRADAAILNAKLRGLMLRYQSEIDKVEYAGALNCQELVRLLKSSREKRGRTLGSVFDEYASTASVKPSSLALFVTQWHTLRRHLGEDMPVERVSHTTILGLDKWLRGSGHSPATIVNIMGLLRKIVAYSAHCGYVSRSFNPFDGYKMPRPDVRQAWLSVEDVKAIRDAPLTGAAARCRDLFMLSYCLGGINMADLLRIDFDACRGKLRYVRQKTCNRRKVNKYVAFDIPDEAAAIIARHKGKDGLIKATDAERGNSMKCFIRAHLNQVAKAAGIPYLIFYSARKSFSQHAFNLGVSTSVIDYILGHKLDSGGTSLYSYISVTPEMATAAVRKVLDGLK